MALVVQKFGGTSVADTDRIREIAEHISLTRRMGNEVVVVVSAMGKTTDNLVRQASEVSDLPPGRELDMLLTSGERISMALLCMALARVGVPASSYTGSQAGIITDTRHGRAKILEIRPDRIREALARNEVPVIAGFQGVSTTKDVTTLGRGGSDTTAVALAASLEADVCEIYTDVSGVFSADPRIVPHARRLPVVSFEEMLDIAATGGRVLALRSVEFARRYGVPICVRSSFTWEPGTWIREETKMEESIVTAVTHDTSESKVTIAGLPDKPGVAAKLFREIAKSGANIDMIVQNVSDEGYTDISFTVPHTDLQATLVAAEDAGRVLGASDTSADSGVARVSVIGAGMKSNAGIAAKMFETLAASNVNIEMISTSSIRISCVIRQDQVETAVRSLHSAFGLDVE